MSGSRTIRDLLAMLVAFALCATPILAQSIAGQGPPSVPSRTCAVPGSSSLLVIVATITASIGATIIAMRYQSSKSS